MEIKDWSKIDFTFHKYSAHLLFTMQESVTLDYWFDF